MKTIFCLLALLLSQSVFADLDDVLYPGTLLPAKIVNGTYFEYVQATSTAPAQTFEVSLNMNKMKVRVRKFEGFNPDNPMESEAEIGEPLLLSGKCTDTYPKNSSTHNGYIDLTCAFPKSPTTYVRFLLYVYPTSNGISQTPNTFVLNDGSDPYNPTSVIVSLRKIQ